MPEPLYRSRPSAFEINPASAPTALPVGDRHLGVARPVEQLPAHDRRRTGGDQHRDGLRGADPPGELRRVDTSPVRYIVLTQGHYDHVGGVDVLRDDGTEIVAQANWAAVARRQRAARAVPVEQRRLRLDRRDHGRARLRARTRRRCGRSRSSPTRADDRVRRPCTTSPSAAVDSSSMPTPGGETTDSLVVWLPDEGVCLCGNVFGALFGHIPNLVTMRGDRYRDAHTFVESVETVRRLRPEVLLTGHFDPIVGADVIDDELIRLRDAVLFVHDRTVEGMNDGVDVQTLMRDVVLPPRARGRAGLREGQLGRARDLGDATPAGSTTTRQPSCTRSTRHPRRPTWSSWRVAPTRCSIEHGPATAAGEPARRHRTGRGRARGRTEPPGCAGGRWSWPTRPSSPRAPTSGRPPGYAARLPRCRHEPSHVRLRWVPRQSSPAVRAGSATPSQWRSAAPAPR